MRGIQSASKPSPEEGGYHVDLFFLHIHGVTQLSTRDPRNLSRQNHSQSLIIKIGQGTVGLDLSVSSHRRRKTQAYNAFLIIIERTPFLLGNHAFAFSDLQHVLEIFF